MRRAQAKAASSGAETETAAQRRSAAERIARAFEESPPRQPFTSDDLQAIVASAKRHAIAITFEEGGETLRGKLIEVKSKNVVVSVDGKKRIVDYSSIVAANQVPED